LKEYDQVFTTYPYSDPDPVPAMSRFYPYFRYDGFTDTPIQKKWKVVELSNDYLRVLILPEVGGKVWAAIDKTTGKPFIYFNHVSSSATFHAVPDQRRHRGQLRHHRPRPTVSPRGLPRRRNRDGSASCFTGTLVAHPHHLRLEINLPPTRPASPLARSGTTPPRSMGLLHLDERRHQVAGNLLLVPPAPTIGHDGSAFSLTQNAATSGMPENFGSYNYHVWAGSPVLRRYWHDEDWHGPLRRLATSRAARFGSGACPAKA
jgi:hypothetical protein